MARDTTGASIARLLSALLLAAVCVVSFVSSVMVGLLALVIGPSTEQSVIMRMASVVLGLLASAWLVAAVLFGVSALSALRHRGQAPKRVWVAPVALMAIGIAFAAGATFIVEYVTLLAGSPGAEGVSDWNGPVPTGPAGIWVALVVVAVVCTFSLRVAPRIAAAGEVAVVLAGYTAILARDEVWPMLSALLWSLASSLMIAGAILAWTRWGWGDGARRRAQAADAEDGAASPGGR